MKKGRRWLLVAPLLLVVVAGLAWGMWRLWPRHRAAAKPRPRLVVTAVARQQDLLITVDETGSLSTTESTPIVPGVGGRLVWVAANGIMVAKGQPVAQMDPTDTLKQYDRQLEQVQAAERALAQAKEKREATNRAEKLKVEKATTESDSFERQQRATLREREKAIAFRAAELEKQVDEVDVKRRMAEQGIIAGIEVEREQARLKAEQFSLQRDRTNFELEKAKAEAEIETKQEAKKNAEHDADRSRRRADGDVTDAENSLASLKLNLSRTRQNLQDMTLKAPEAGLLVLGEEGWPERRPIRAGDYLWEGRQLGTVVNLGQMEIKLELDQQQVSNLQTGQQALVEVDAIPGKVFKGKVVMIGRTARRAPSEGWHDSNEMTFPVTVELPPDPKTKMRPGMRVNVRIVVDRVPKAVVVPSECIFTRTKRKVVYVQRGGTYQAVEVKVGRSNADYTAVMSGLKAGESVALNDLNGSAAKGASSRAKPAADGRAGAAQPAKAATR